MSDRSPLSDSALDALVRRTLDAESDGIDPRPVFNRLQHSLFPSDVRTPGRSTKRLRLLARPWILGISAAAASLLLVLLWPGPPRPALAKAEVLVREAKSVHRLPLDRCYLVEVRRDSALFDELSPLTSQVRQTRLWTRGDRFWVESVDSRQRWAWGRNERNRFWIAFGPRRGLLLEPDEIPRWLNLYSDLYCIRLEALLGDVLSDFDLERESTNSDSFSATEAVRAKLKPGHRHPSIRSAVIEIDAETRVVRKMVTERSWRGQPFATATYTLVESNTLDETKYQPEGHLTAPYKLYSPNFEPERRRELLTLWLGPRAASWIKLRGEK